MQHLFKAPPTEMPIYTRTDHFPNCCGIDVITGFPHPEAVSEIQIGEWMKRTGYTEDKERNKHLIENARSDIKKTLRNPNTSNSVMLIVLNHLQNKIYSDMVRSEGFEPILSDAYHSGHGHTLFIYARKKYERTTPTMNV